MSMITIIQDATDALLNTARPTTVEYTDDDTIRQMVIMLNISGNDLVSYYPWQALTKKVDKTATPDEDQGSLDTLAPGFRSFINDTVWLGSMPFKPLGPLTPQQRTGLEAFNINNPVWSYWIEGNHLFIRRPPASSQRLLFRYQTSHWVNKTDGGTSNKMVADGDTSAIPEDVLTLAIIWRWLQRNGLPYAQEYMDYRNLLNLYIGRDGMRDTVNACGGIRDYSPMQSVVGGVFKI